ncbi:hypothetical protein Y032_0551g3323 [Ancylostoma ceylanicum]|uniref:acid phosphatase n=1 Tax=Ancylostoma ceylanicum TaxID=53326 RepID=A0A016WRL1_9BILA|nr:hypothetical protein Y032_0551g3323 [Ancylostoma ceylanicum]
MLALLNSKCGQPINLDYLHVVRDPLYVEQIYFNDTLRKVNTWFTDQLFAELNVMYEQMERYKNGDFNTTVEAKGLDIGLELKKVRGWPIFNEVTEHMNSKLECLKSGEAKCKWIKRLKYFVYSVHDSTVFTFLSLMGIERKVIVSGVFPEYSAAVLVELWLNHTDNQPYFKLMYHPDDKSAIHPVTKEIARCDGKKFCKLDVFRSIADKFKPPKPMHQWCETNPGEENSDGSNTATWSFCILVLAAASYLWPHF